MAAVGRPNVGKAVYSMPLAQDRSITETRDPAPDLRINKHGRNTVRVLTPRGSTTRTITSESWGSAEAGGDRRCERFAGCDISRPQAQQD
jgi:hypothetical protein